MTNDYKNTEIQKIIQIKNQLKGETSSFCFAIFRFELVYQRDIPYDFVGYTTHTENIYIQIIADMYGLSANVPTDLMLGH